MDPQHGLALSSLQSRLPYASGIRPYQGRALQAATTHVTRPPNRFAVAAFDTLADAQKAGEQLCSGSSPLCDISYLGLQRVVTPGPALSYSSLPFPGNAAPLCCSPGPIADRLAARLGAGTRSLQAALTTWLIPRHAAQLQRTVDAGKIVLWVQLADHADEQRAYRTLTAAGCTTVGMHDLVGG